MSEAGNNHSSWRWAKNLKVVSIGHLFVLGLTILGGLVLISSINTIQNISTTDSAWTLFEEAQSEKSHALNRLRAELGYGGMIHHFKNFVLRGDEERMRLAELNFGGAKSAISNYQLLVLSEKEKQALEDIGRTIDQYYASLIKTNELFDLEYSPQEIDRVVIVNDIPALEGLNTLADEISGEEHRKLKNSDHNKSLNKVRLINQLRKAIGYGGMIHINPAIKNI